ncbi:ABC transporter ATP-binding protein [Deinococcus aestuarii]|uniref:ABC transporter ATP-binding protein n=1 Tax=Deinococcus aestuarii TaxID=2774531 RepID=UPI001C0D431F|nr:ABC transporter ATP-binding protein [Deinococcus aestuarii]
MRHLEKSYPAVAGTPSNVLKAIDLDVRAGEYVAIVGASGCGKSTLMHIMGLLDAPSGGSYHFDGADVTHLSEVQRAAHRNRDIGFIFQAFVLLPGLTVLENATLALRLRGVTRREREARAMLVLERVGLASRAHHHPHQLSGGQKQRVAIARSLLQEPRLILADEPTGNLDPAATEDVLTLFAEANAQGTTVVVITHDERVARAAGSCIRLRDGEVFTQALPGTPAVRRSA